MLIDELFNEYRQKHGKDRGLLDRIAREAQQFCMARSYWNRRLGFYRRISQDEALTVFHDTFLKCVERGLECKTELSGCLSFYFPRRLIDYIRVRGSSPEFLISESKNDDRSIEDLVDAIKQKRDPTCLPEPESNLLLKDRVNLLLRELERFSKRERDMLILNAKGFSRGQIAQVLELESKQVNKGKFDSRNKLRKILHQAE